MSTAEQISAIVKGRRGFRVLPFPGSSTLTVAVRVLTEEEAFQCRARALQLISEQAKASNWDVASVAMVDPQYLEGLQKRCIVQKAFFDANTVEGDKPIPLWASDKQLAADVDAVTLQRLFEMYLEHQDFVSPFRALDDADVAKLVDDLGKDTGRAARSAEFLGGLERSTLARLCISLASALRSKT